MRIAAGPRLPRVVATPRGHHGLPSARGPVSAQAGGPGGEAAGRASCTEGGRASMRGRCAHSAQRVRADVGAGMFGPARVRPSVRAWAPAAFREAGCGALDSRTPRRPVAACGQVRARACPAHAGALGAGGETQSNPRRRLLRAAAPPTASKGPQGRSQACDIACWVALQSAGCTDSGGTPAHLPMYLPSVSGNRAFFPAAAFWKVRAKWLSKTSWPAPAL